MANISATSNEGVLNRPAYNWETVTENDTPVAQRIEGGKYTCTVEKGNNGAGSFGGGSIEFQYSKTGNDYHSIDITNLSFSSSGSFNIEVGRGYVKPVRTGGSSMDLDVFLTPIPEVNS
jgi:hypothetical protein